MKTWTVTGGLCGRRKSFTKAERCKE